MSKKKSKKNKNRYVTRREYDMLSKDIRELKNKILQAIEEDKMSNKIVERKRKKCKDKLRIEKERADNSEVLLRDFLSKLKPLLSQASEDIAILKNIPVQSNSADK